MKIKFMPMNVECDVDPSKSLLEIAKANGLKIKSICNGVPSCAECRVRITSGDNSIPEPSKAELSLIGTSYFLDGRRLSCQVRCFGPVTVDLTEQLNKVDTQKKVRGFKQKDQKEISAVQDTMILSPVEAQAQAQKAAEKATEQAQHAQERQQQKPQGSPQPGLTPKPQQQNNQNSNQNRQPNHNQQRGQQGGGPRNQNQGGGKNQNHQQRQTQGQGSGQGGSGVGKGNAKNHKPHTNNQNTSRNNQNNNQNRNQNQNQNSNQNRNQNSNQNRNQNQPNPKPTAQAAGPVQGQQTPAAVFAAQDGDKKPNTND